MSVVDRYNAMRTQRVRSTVVTSEGSVPCWLADHTGTWNTEPTMALHVTPSEAAAFASMYGGVAEEVPS